MEEESQAKGGELKRALGWWSVFAFSFGGILGTTMFFCSVIGARHGGNASILAWPFITIFALYIAGCFGELVSMFPKAGGIYEFSKHAYGRFLSFLIGWMAWVSGILASSVLIVAAMDYLLPEQGRLFKIGVSVLTIVVLNIMALIGIEEGGRIMIIFVFVTLAICLSVIGFGLVHFNPTNFTPFFTAGFSQILIAGFFFLESFFGWEAVTYLAEETKEPEKNIPKALLLGTLAVAVMAFGIHVVSYGNVRWETFATSAAPLAYLSKVLFGPTYAVLLSIGIFVTLMGSAASIVITHPRLLLALSRDRLFLSQFEKVHHRFRTPYMAIMLQMVVSLLIVLMIFGKYEWLLSLLLPIGMIVYTLTLLTIPILRGKPNYQPRFRVPFGNAGPFICILFFITLILAWVLTEPMAFSMLKFGISLLLVGIPLYLLIELYYDPHMITEVKDLTAYFTLFTERFFIPLGVRNEILAWLGDVRGKTVLEFGCGVGTLTMHLAEAVGPEGTVYATDLSFNDLKITRKRLERAIRGSFTRIHGRVHVLYDNVHTVRIHPEVKYADVIVSFGMLGSVHDINKVLREMNSVMPEGGKICFVEYADYFMKMIPNVDWLSRNEGIEKIFRQAGFSVRVVRKRSIFWNFIFLYGIKSAVDVPVI